MTTIKKWRSDSETWESDIESTPDDKLFGINTVDDFSGPRQMSKSLPITSNNFQYLKVPSNDNQSEDERNFRSHSLDDFDDSHNYLREKSIKTGRQRTKLSARRKGGDFQSSRLKKRVYCCCISSDIDLQGLFEFLININSPQNWRCQRYNDCLHLYRSDSKVNGNVNLIPFINKRKVVEDQPILPNDDHSDIDHGSFISVDSAEYEESFDLGAMGAQEIFIFDFGAAVFWNFYRGEEGKFVKVFRDFATEGKIEMSEFRSGEDDMGYVFKPDTYKVKIASDMVSLPVKAPIRQRLSVSFAIAQSSVLTIFESRIEKKVEEYEYIPEALAKYGKIYLSEKKLGMMTGEVFAIRHDVNLNTEILDIPDFFWTEHRFRKDYEMAVKYFEMKSRIDILNKRIYMLTELIGVLRQQNDVSHAADIEWIVIYLIIADVVLKIISMFVCDFCLARI